MIWIAIITTALLFLVLHKMWIIRKKHLEKMAIDKKMKDDMMTLMAAEKKTAEEFRNAHKVRYEFGCIDFDLNPKTYIYIEPHASEIICKYISMHYDDLCKQFRFAGKEFLFIYSEIDNMLRTEYADYISLHDQVPTNDAMASLLESIGCQNKDGIVPSIIWLSERNEDKTVFEGFEIHRDSEEELDEYFKSIILAVKYEEGFESANRFDEQIRHSNIHGKFYGCFDCIVADEDEWSGGVSEPEDVEYRGEGVSPEDLRELEEVQRTLARLRKKGINEAFLDRYLVPKVELTAIHITKDMNIVLPMLEKEVRLLPLPKAIYLLFLKHPEGIRLKCLVDHRKELECLYENVKGRPLTDSNLRSINLIVNPTNNSIHEKLSHIRDAFISCMPEHIASNYYIDGEVGEEKKIPLPTEMVVWE